MDEETKKPISEEALESEQKYREIEEKLAVKRKRNRTTRFIVSTVVIVFLTALALAGIVGVIWLKDQIENDTLEEWVNLSKPGSTITRITGSVNTIDTENTRKSAWLDGLATVSTTCARYLTLDGKKGFDETVTLAEPALTVNDDYFLCYDLAGTNIYLYDKDGLVSETTAEGPILSASISPQGVICVLSEADDCLSVLSVYTRYMKRFFQWRNTERYLISAAYCDSNGKCLVSSVYEADNALQGKLLTLDTAKEGVQTEADLADAVPYAVFNTNDGFAVMTSTGVIYTGPEGVQTQNVPVYGDVNAYECAGNGCFYILASDSNSEYLVRVMRGDKQVLPIDHDDEVRVLTCGGGLAGVLFSNRVVIYDAFLKEKRTIQVSNISDISVISDGHCVLFSGDNVTVS